MYHQGRKHLQAAFSVVLLWVTFVFPCSTMAQSLAEKSTVLTNPWSIPGSFRVKETNGSVDGAFDVYIKYPVRDKAKSPVVLFFNGFQSRYSWYSELLDAVASWGFITIQYQLPALSMMSVETELQTLYNPLISWVENGGLQDLLDPISDITVDLNSVFSSGHSRGGKVASLVFTEDDDRPLSLIKAAFLIDPVDSSGFAPVSPENPSAVASLAASGKKIAVAGASIKGSCNPVEGNYEKFFDAGSPGSWEIVLNGTSHSQFAIAGGIMDILSDSLCGRGTQSGTQIAKAVASSMVSWFIENGNTAKTYKDCVMKNFFAGIQSRAAQNLLSFSMKM